MPDALDHIPPDRRAEADQLDALFRQATGWHPKVWGKTVGYGKYHYQYASGREGDCFATGFAMRAKNISIHILPGYSEFPDIAARLGPHKRGKSCWYITSLERVDDEALKDLIQAGLKDLATHFRVEET